MPDFTQYQPPGVYVEEETSPLVSVIGVAPTLVALVGPSVGYRTHTEAVTLTGTAAVALAKLGINVATGFTVASADGTPYAASEFAVVVGAGADATLGTTVDNTTTLARAADSDIDSGETVYVTYRYTDAEYAAPFTANDFDDVKDAFGEPLDLATGAVLSPLSLAAKVAFENGARDLVLVATEGTATAVTRTQLAAGLAKLESVYDVNVVVPLPVGLTGTAVAPGDVINVGDDLAAHVAAMEQEGLQRVGILGTESTVSVLPDVIAEGIANKRVMLAWPNRLNYWNGQTNQNIEVAGYYLAAAYAGRMAALPVQTPLTKQTIRGFSGVPAALLQTMSKSTKNAWSKAGVAVTEVLRNGSLVVRHGTTTDPTNVNTRELSLVRARDALVRLVQDTTDGSNLIGQPIDEETPIRVKGVVAGVLESARDTGIIVRYQNLKVRQRSLEPTIIEVKFQYLPAYPLNYIVISFSIDTMTGEIAPIENIAA